MHDKLGKQRFSGARLIGIHSTESHILLRFIPDFLKENKMKKYKYDLFDEISNGYDSYYIIKINSNRYLRGGILHVSMEDFGVRYMKKIYKDEDWRDLSETNSTEESFYIKDGDKWNFTHGVKQRTWYLKKQDIRIKSSRITKTIKIK